MPKKNHIELKSFISNCLVNFIFKIEISLMPSLVIIMSSTYKDKIIQHASVHLIKRVESWLLEINSRE
jgi:hypothetical protein